MTDAPPTSAPNTTKLLPCPFCGQVEIFLNEPGVAQPYGCINCPSCMAVVPGAIGGPTREEELVKAWNTRASALPPSGVDRPMGYAPVIDVEKLLCEKLGKSWSATGMSIVTLVDELAARSNAPQWEPGPPTLASAMMALRGSQVCDIFYKGDTLTNYLDLSELDAFGPTHKFDDDERPWRIAEAIYNAAIRGHQETLRRLAADPTDAVAVSWSTPLKPLPVASYDGGGA